MKTDYIVVFGIFIVLFGIYATYMMHMTKRIHTELYKLRMFIIADKLKKEERK